MIELTQSMIDQKCSVEMASFALFLYTPFCGTCKLAERMLMIITETDPAIVMYKANINRLPSLAIDWKISSVPALLIIHQGEVTRQLYALQSVDYLYRVLKSRS